MKIGDRVKDKTTGKSYIIRMEIGNDTLCLESPEGEFFVRKPKRGQERF